MDYIEEIKVKSSEMLCIDLGSDYITVYKVGTIDSEYHFIWNHLEVTEGGASVSSRLITRTQLIDHIESLTSSTIDKYPDIVKYLNV